MNDDERTELILVLAVVLASVVLFELRFPRPLPALRASGVPFVLASAYDRPELAAADLAGATNVGKPMSDRRLLAALAQIVGP